MRRKSHGMLPVRKLESRDLNLNSELRFLFAMKENWKIIEMQHQRFRTSGRRCVIWTVPCWLHHSYCRLGNRGLFTSCPWKVDWSGHYLHGRPWNHHWSYNNAPEGSSRMKNSRRAEPVHRESETALPVLILPYRGRNSRKCCACKS
jgi:hypothetical protein